MVISDYHEYAFGYIKDEISKETNVFVELQLSFNIRNPEILLVRKISDGKILFKKYG